MRFDPFSANHDPTRIPELCQAVGLPKPTGLTPVDPPGPVVHCIVELEDGRGSLLALDVDGVDGTGFFGALAASRLLDDEPGFMFRPVLIPPRDILGGWAMVGRPLQGARGNELLARGEWTAEALCGAAGRFLGRLWSVPVMRSGCRANPDGFLSLSGSWGLDWRARAERLARVAHRRGVGFPMLKRLLAQIDPGLLPDVPPSLGLSDLSPERLFLDGDEVVGVLGWESAFAGDPLASLGSLLHLPGPLLKAVLDGTGQGEAIAHELPRLKVYAASSALRLLADAGSQSRGPVDRAQRIELALDVARSALDGSLESRISGVGAVRHDGQRRARMRRALNALGNEPIVGAHRPVLQACMATAILAHDFADSPLEQGWSQVADRYLGQMELGLNVRPSGDMSGDWVSHFVGLFERCQGSGGSVRTDALVGSWLVWQACIRVGKEICAPTVAGLQEWSAFAAAGDQGVLPAHDALLSGVLGLGATLHIQSELGLLDGSVPLVAVLSRQVSQAWDALGSGGSEPDKTPARQTLAHYADPASHADVSVPVAPLLLAIRYAEKELPAPPGEMLKQLGVSPC